MKVTIETTKPKINSTTLFFKPYRRRVYPLPGINAHSLIAILHMMFGIYSKFVRNTKI